MATTEFPVSSELPGEVQAPYVLMSSKDEDVYTVPTIQAINDQIAQASNFEVQDLVIGHRIHGFITLEGVQNIKGLEIDDLVEFGGQSLMLASWGKYMPKGNIKVTLYNMFPEDLDLIEEYGECLKKACDESPSKTFVSYHQGIFVYTQTM